MRQREGHARQKVMECHHVEGIYTMETMYHSQDSDRVHASAGNWGNLSEVVTSCHAVCLLQLLVSCTCHLSTPVSPMHMHGKLWLGTRCHAAVLIRYQTETCDHQRTHKLHCKCIVQVCV